jgi:hypothetical protein
LVFVFLEIVFLFEELHVILKIIIVNTAVPRPWKVANNSLIKSVAANYGQVNLVDWDQISAGHSEYFAPDGVHLVPTGVVAYVNAIEKFL